MQITDDHFRSIVDDGYVVLRGYIQGKQLAELQAAQLRCIPTWEQVKDKPPDGGSILKPYPYGDPLMDRLFLDPPILALGRRYFKTERLHARVGYMLGRYPGFVSGDTGHIDNGNNSLLPPSPTLREYSQWSVWIHLFAVSEDQAPLRLVKHQDGRDLSKAEKLVCPAGTVAIFRTDTFHAASTYEGTSGERLGWGFILGRADHDFEGLMTFTNMAANPHFKRAVASMSAAERTLFRFPPPNHEYYTAATLAALEEMYPGWNTSGEYQPVD